MDVKNLPHEACDAMILSYQVNSNRMKKQNTTRRRCLRYTSDAIIRHSSIVIPPRVYPVAWGSCLSVALGSWP